jgi:UDP-glucose 4-epimerase
MEVCFCGNWSDLVNVVIIGAAGFLGRNLSKHFAQLGHRVTGFDVAEPGFEEHGVTFHLVDVLCESIEIPTGTDVVFYLAQSEHHRTFPKYADHLFGVNTFGAIKAAKAAFDQRVRFFCYASSGNVYAPSFAPLGEDQPLNRGNAYAQSKLMAEEALKLFQGPMVAVSVRFFGLFGAGQSGRLPFKILKAIESGQKIFLEPSPVHKKDKSGLKVSFSYTVDVAYCLEKLARLALDGVPLPSALNVAGPEAISILDFAETLGAVLGKKPHFEVSKQFRKFDLIADISTLKTLIDPDFTSFEKAVAAAFSRSKAKP